MGINDVPKNWIDNSARAEVVARAGKKWRELAKELIRKGEFFGASNIEEIAEGRESDAEIIYEADNIAKSMTDQELEVEISKLEAGLQVILKKPGQEELSEKEINQRLEKIGVRGKDLREKIQWIFAGRDQFKAILEERHKK